MKLEDCKGYWALVTGASSGIGAEFCRQLSASGMNLIMVARRADLLQRLAGELQGRDGIRTLVLPVELGRSGSALEVKDAVLAAGVHVRLLINNAAFGPWGSFEKTPAQTYEEMVQLMAATPIALCHHFMSDLESFPNSAIVNVSSPAALQPVPYLAVYAATKACLQSFSLALYGEWASRGIQVQTLLPGPTATEFDAKGRAYKSDLGEERRPAAEVVALCLAGLARDAPLVTSYGGVYKQRVFAGLAPIKMVIREVKKMFAAPPGR